MLAWQSYQVESLALTAGGVQKHYFEGLIVVDAYSKGCSVDLLAAAAAAGSIYCSAGLSAFVAVAAYQACYSVDQPAGCVEYL